MKKISFKSRPIPTQKRTAHWALENASHFALALTKSAKNSDQNLVVIVRSMKEAEELRDDCHFFGGEAEIFPDTETLPYDPFSPQVDIISRRLAILSKIKSGQIPLTIITVPTLMQRVAPTHFLAANVLLLETGSRMDIEAFRQNLEKAGYLAVNNVISPGEFAVRGAIFDLYPMGYHTPIRIDFFDDEIDSIYTFDPDTQHTDEKLEIFSLLPAREFDTSSEAIARFKEKFEAAFGDNPERSLIYKEIIKGNLPSGIESYFPLFFQDTSTFFDYLPPKTTLITFPSLETEGLRFQKLIDERYERYRHDMTRPLLPPSRLFLTLSALSGTIGDYPQVSLEFNAPIYPNITLDHLKAQMDESFPLVICTETSGRRETLIGRLENESITPTVFSSINAVFDAPTPLAIVTGTLRHGFRLETPPLTLITEDEFLGITRSRYRSKEKVANIENMLTSLDELKPGDPVIHLTHGIGRYDGLATIDNTELVVIRYQDNAKLYLPITSLDLLAAYSGTDKTKAPWHKLGSDQWDKAKRKAAEKANDTAAELLDLYAKREAQPAKGMSFPEEEYRAFSESFPYETTPDQQRAIDEIIEDLKEGKMDRIICGDVGFGKTEVAMRAAFVAVMNGYQVALLAPTTLLAEQHGESFQDRFAELPVKIATLSRFRKTKETREILAAAEKGELDIIVGTHKLLSDDVKFNNLGLVIIDEEHRFGVKQKEKLKSMRAEVNFLAMTATPIPRTLNMGLSGLKSLSIIATPPENRIAIKTFLNEWSDELVLEACHREFKRGGQVYFLHNEVRTIESVRERLEALFPDITIAVAHGQMRETELEKVMLDFHSHRVNMLLCTTIIESGIDIPNANTIIINRADHLGLAQLHQIRGRVGRSHHRAFCYLIVPPAKEMTSDAKKRIEAIMSTDTLGAGFMLANHDLEIRGAGELLGDQQSGEIHSIGFSLYMDLLSRAVKMVKSGQKLNLEEPFNPTTEISIGVPALINELYIGDVSVRLSFYKRLASAADQEEIDNIHIEMIDRFGLLPEETKFLVRLTELKLLARPLNVSKIEASKEGIRIIFGDNPHLDAERLIELIQKEPHLYQLQGQELLRYKVPLENPELRINAIVKLIKALLPKPHKADSDA